MFSDYQYDPSDGISYPLDYRPPGLDGFLLKKRGPLNPVYPESLVSLCKSTENDLIRLKDQLVQFDPCYAHDMKHWHKAHKKYEPLFSGDSPKWSSTDGLFADAQKVNLKGWKQNQHHDEQEDYKDGPKECRICYLCTTLDEHKQHIVRRGPQLKPKTKPKTKIKYIAPPPVVKKKEEETTEKQEVLYKFIVKTGNKPQAGTSAKVSFRLKGRKGWMKKKQLKKNLAVHFCFGPGTSETFYIKGPNIGELLWLIIEHDGLEKKHSWYLEEVEIINMNTSEAFIFICKQWLSLYLGDYSIKRQLKAQISEPRDMEYEVKVFTAKERMAGTDANVFITLYGKKGVSSKIQLQNKSKNNFERGSEDVFRITTQEIGALSNIRLEHDNTGACPGWLLEKVVIQELDDPGRKYIFPCGQWFARSEGDGKICRTLYPLKGNKNKLGKEAKDEGLDNQIIYEVDITTGKKKYAGTDATIFIKLYGKVGVSRELEFRDENGKRFEKGSVDHFRLPGDDVGDIKKIQVRHNNKGLGSGWFCKQILIKRFFSKEEIIEHLNEMMENFDKDVSRRVSQLTGEGAEMKRHQQCLKFKRSESIISEDDRERSPDYRRPSSSKRNSDRDFDEETKYNRRKSTTKGKKVTYQGINHYVSDDDDDDDDDDSESDFSTHHRRSGKQKPRNHDRNYDGRLDDSDNEDTRWSRRGKNHEKHSRGSPAKSHSGWHRRKSTSSSDSSDEEEHEDLYTTYKKDRIPYYDEYLFQCEQWLAEDEGDGQIMKILKPKSITTFYKMMNTT